MGSRTHIKDASLVLSFALNGVPTAITVRGSLYSTEKSERSRGQGLSQFCPECQGSIRHHLYCDNEHGPFQRDAVLRGRVVDEKVVIVDGDEATDAATSAIPRGKFDLTIVDRKSFLEGATPHGVTYHFSPNPQDDADVEAYTILHTAVTANPDWAFVCRANLGRGAETLVSIEAGPFGGLVVQPHAYPETLYDLPAYDQVEVAPEAAATIRDFLADKVGEFDPEEWNNRLADNVDGLVAAASKRRTTKATKKPKAQEAPSLMAALQAAVQRQAS